MRLTYDDIKNQFLRNIGKQGSTDTTILADFNNNLGQRYQMSFAQLKNYMTSIPKTSTTVADQQYYYYPVGINKVDDCVITVGSVNYPLNTVSSQHAWDLLNAIEIQPSAIPQFIYPRRDDFGIFPIPQDAYTITFNFYLRDRNLSVSDYTIGSVTLTNGDATVTGDGTTFTSAMIGRWFTITDTTTPGQGYWYRVASYTSATSIELENAWQDTTIASAVSYRIGECPELPEEGHIILADGVTADFYAGIRSDIEKATWFNNKFWTGDGNNPLRKVGDPNIAGGLLGMVNRYSTRDDSKVIQRQLKLDSPEMKIWGTTLT